MTFEKAELVKHIIRTEGLGLPQAIKKVNEMSDTEIQKKREEIATHTHFNKKGR